MEQQFQTASFAEDGAILPLLPRPAAPNFVNTRLDGSLAHHISLLFVSPTGPY
ncbi:hypothetical protein PLANPX_5400 [Lacipirellula parvula]|uniref:Uncharacterized protein n=1 Tax=Lacipirellula parvula TaxID=2650471 RepID=A0A5K7XH73_9BACT|nr:hypothetical protein PLANPX_5400 [Lacipirellula parvula]